MPTVVRNIDQDIALIEQGVRDVVRDMAQQTGDIVVGFSPVLTGFFVHNWNDSTGAPNTRVRGRRPNETTRSFSDPSFSVSFSWDIGDGDIYFTNDVDYADILDGGGSQQAPQGVTDPSASIVDSRFRRVEI